MIDLESEPLSGTFMGNTIFRVADADFSEPRQNAGWRGLFEWCLRLDTAISSLGAGASEHQISEPVSDERMTLRAEGAELVVNWTRSADIGRVETRRFLDEAKRFLCRSVCWIDAEYPAAARNQSAGYIWDRLERYR